MFKSHAVRHFEDLLCGQYQCVCISAEFWHGHNTITDGKSGHLGADLIDDSRYFVTDYARDRGRILVHSRSSHQISEIDATGADGNSYLTCFRDGIGGFLHLEDFGRAGFGYPYLSHSGRWYRRNRPGKQARRSPLNLSVMSGKQRGKYRLLASQYRGIRLSFAVFGLAEIEKPGNPQVGVKNTVARRRIFYMVEPGSTSAETRTAPGTFSASKRRKSVCSVFTCLVRNRICQRQRS